MITALKEYMHHVMSATKKVNMRDGLCIAHVIFFLKLGFTPCKAEHTATTRHGVTRKRCTKRLEHTGNLFRKNLQSKDVC